MNHYDIAIVGGGLAGLTFALSLSDSNLKIAVIEGHSFDEMIKASFDGRTTAIAHGPADIYRDAGVWDEMESLSGPITDIRIADGYSPMSLHYSHDEVGDAPMGYICENADMRRIILTKLKKQKNVALLSPVKVTDTFMKGNTRVVSLDNGEELSCNLLAASDSKFSKLRDMLGIDHKRYDYGQTAMITLIKHEKPHKGLALERFMSAGPFASLPMKDEHLSAIVWTEEDDRVKAYLDADDDTFMQAFAKRFGDHLGTLKLAGARAAYPLCLIHANRYTAERAILVGDAAHAIHPIAGQGFNLSLRDIKELKKILLNQAQLGLDVGDTSILTGYERLRRSDNHLMIAATHGLNKLFSNRSRTVGLARRLGLMAVSSMPKLKQGFIRQAMGV